MKRTKGIQLLLCGSLLACASPQLVTSHDVETIAIGSTPSYVEQQLGKPYESKKTAQGQRWTYIERIYHGKSQHQRHFHLLFNEGHLVNVESEEISGTMVEVGQ